MILGISEVFGRGNVFAGCCDAAARTSLLAFQTRVATQFARARNVHPIQILLGPENFHAREFADPKRLSMSWIYHALFGDIKRASDGALVVATKIGFTLDSRMGEQQCPTTNRRYSTIRVGGRELAYVIVCTVEELVDVLYESPPAF